MVPASQTWFHRNRLWLALLVPALILAVAASSYRVVNWLLPLTWSRPHVAASSSLTFHQRFDRGDAEKTFERTVTITVDSFGRVTESEGYRAAATAQLWEVRLTMAADPDQVLIYCGMEVEDADGVRYGVEGGKVQVDPRRFTFRHTVTCVPEDAPGPSLTPFTNELVPSPQTRPASWPVVASFALPDGVTPTKVRVFWDQPDYAVLPLG